MANLARYTHPLVDLDVSWIYDDFTSDQSDLFFVDTITDTGSAAVGDARKGIMVLTPSDGTVADNDEVYLASANELFIFLAGKPIYGKCSLQFTETTAGVYNCFFGFQNAVAANSLVDDGGSMRASGCCVAIVKLDGEQYWRAYSRNGSTVTSTLSTTSSTSSDYQVLEIDVIDWDGVSMQCLFKVNGSYLKDSSGAVIKHTVLIASATEMQVALGAKLGAATNNDFLNVDYIYAHQLR